MINYIFGTILILDAIVSMIVFREQEWYCQFVRIVRLVIGIALLFGG